MIQFRRILPFIIYCIPISYLSSQGAVPCPNINVINEDPIEEGFYQAGQINWSAGKVRPFSNVKFGSFDYTYLDKGFEVELEATFFASMDGCDPACVEAPLCVGVPCPPLPEKLDSRGRAFEPRSIVVSLPRDVDVNMQYQQNILAYLNDINGLPAGSSSIRRCLCNSNIFIYETNVPINEEGTIGQATVGYGPDGEGIIYSLNYYVEPDFAELNDNAPTQMFDPQQYMDISSQESNKVVAFLDTGVDPIFLPPNSILKTPPTNCLGNDFYGWNFIDNNNNVLDDRGHGTAVILNYLFSLNLLGIPFNQQQILPVKVLDECGRGTIYSVVCGLYYAESKNAKIINNSWGLYFNDVQLQEAITHLNDLEIPVSCSAGNSAKDLNITEHFPSGYARDFIKIRRDYTTIDTSGFPFVFEVGGLCRPVKSTTPAALVDLWPETNYRDFMFVEAAIREEDLLNATGIFSPPINCGISGTSYAAPQLTAGMVHFCIENPGTPIDQNNMQSLTQQIHPVNTHFSYILDKL